MKIFRQALTMIFFAASCTIGRGAENPPATLDSILQHAIERAKQESDDGHAFNQLYSYSREKVTEYHNNAGDLTKHEEKNIVHQPNAPHPLHAKTDADADSEKSGTVSDTHSNVHGKAFKTTDFQLNADLINRYVFTLVGTETINGRPAYVVDFAPAKKDLPERNLKDRFINKAGGRAWVDAQDYALVKADLHLTRPVDVAWGLVGAIWKFDYSFDRERTDDGYWFVRDVNWHLEGREVVIDRTVDYHETMSNLQKVGAVAAR